MFKKIGILFLLTLSLGFFHSCKNENPSVVKVFVRSSSNQLVPGAKVIVVGDVDSNPETKEYVDTLITNESGFVEFNLAPHFELGGKDYEIAYFDILVKSSVSGDGSGYVRARIHTTAVETVYTQ
tara:strand:+ start:4269 stop:4643 length:375 start_codon:yes stop_codon:yes gene_type:complete